jgi:hypothetical protein
MNYLSWKKATSGAVYIDSILVFSVKRQTNFSIPTCSFFTIIANKWLVYYGAIGLAYVRFTPPIAN